MKIMAVSDLHGRLDGLDPSGADVVVLAGDVAPLHGHGRWYVDEQSEWMGGEFRDWTSSYPGVSFCVVPGNHDFYALDLKCEFSPNVRFLLDSGVEIGGIRFYGAPWVPIISYSWAFEAEPDMLRRQFSKIPAGTDVFITHSPPRIPGSDVDRSLQTDSEHFGSSELAEAIMEKRPRLVFCGHIHTGQHGGVDFGESRIYNVSRLDERYEIAYEPTWVKI